MNMKIISRTAAIGLAFIMIFSSLVLTGCESAEDNKYLIYYKNSDSNRLVVAEYYTEEKEIYELVGKLLNQMNTKKDNKNFTLKPDALPILRYEISSDIVNIYFTKQYYDMSNSDEILYRAGLVKTLTQIDGIKYIQIYVDGIIAQNDDGTVVGLLSKEDFVDDSNNGVGVVEWKDITLYYANKTGDKLVAKKETVAYTKNVSLEKMVMEKLIRGTTDTTLSSTLPSGMKLLSISVSENVCYVNLDQTFINEMVNVSSEVEVYSVVNSLCAIKGVDSVRIMINGDNTKTFRETIRLDENLTFNDNIIGN